MADDIVTRLREKYSGQLPICAEAADEIERLRLDRQRWRKIAELAREAWNTDSWIVFNNEYLRMVHND